VKLLVKFRRPQRGKRDLEWLSHCGLWRIVRREWVLPCASVSYDLHLLDADGGVVWSFKNADTLKEVREEADEITSEPREYFGEDSKEVARIEAARNTNHEDKESISPIEAVAKAILDRYVETGTSATVPELAEYMGKSVGFVRKVLGSVTTWKRNMEHAPRNDDFYKHGFEEVFGKTGRNDRREYLPLRRMLRRRILDMKQAAVTGSGT